MGVGRGRDGRSRRGPSGHVLEGMRVLLSTCSVHLSKLTWYSGRPIQYYSIHAKISIIISVFNPSRFLRLC